MTITALPAGTPAYEQGLNTNDQIIAVDGYRASQQFLQTYFGEKKAGDKVKVTIFRFDKLSDIEITLGGKSPQTYKISAVDNPTEEQKNLYRGYFGAELK